jgi:hypothetical protein
VTPNWPDLGSEDIASMLGMAKHPTSLQGDCAMGEQKQPRLRSSTLACYVLGGSASLALVGALAPRNSDLNIVTGAIYGFVLGAIVAVVAHRLRSK